MYPKDTSSEDPGPPPASDGGAGGVQTESGMRSLFQNTSGQAPSPSSASPSSLSEARDNPNNVNITVAPFTGGPFEVKISKMETVEELKKLIARRLKVSKERIYLLYRESELVEGSVSNNLLVDGSTVTLLPRAETGLISPKPEQSVMQALESLNEQQVNDFLSGAAPLNLTMRLGDHMMLIQLQLSTVNQTSSRRHKQTIQISSASPPPYPTPPPSAPSSPSSESGPAPACPGPRKVRVPLLSPGGLYQAAPPARTSGQPHSVQRSARSGGPTESRAPTPPTSGLGSGSGEPPAKKPKLDTKALAEASKNLTQTLKQLSSEVLTTRPESGSSHLPKKEVKDPSQASSTTTTSTSSSSSSSSSSTASSVSSGSSGSSSASSGSSSSSSSGPTRHSRKRHSGRGAIIESMHHHGKGVYSGTFSGTLNPALQDENGQPKRDITTIVHILNDLLCAQYKAYGGSSGSSRSSKHHHHHHHHHHKGESSKSSQSSEKQTSIFEAEARAATEKQLQEEQLNLTRHKVETLRKIMEERRAKREARRQAAAAGRSSGTYSTAWSVSEAKHGDCDKHEDGEHFLLSEPEPVTA